MVVRWVFSSGDREICLPGMAARGRVADASFAHWTYRFDVELIDRWLAILGIVVVQEKLAD